MKENQRWRRNVSRIYRSRYFKTGELKRSASLDSPAAQSSSVFNSHHRLSQDCLSSRLTSATINLGYYYFILRRKRRRPQETCSKQTFVAVQLFALLNSKR